MPGPHPRNSATSSSSTVSRHMLSIKTSGPTRVAKLRGACAHLIPCEVRYSGPANASRRYWSPLYETDQTCITYFRGRCLRGRVFTTPPGYRGCVVRRSGVVNRDKSLIDEMKQDLANNKPDDDDEYILQRQDIEDMDAQGEGSVELEEVSTISNVNSIAIWAHERVPGPTEEGVGRSMAEWFKFASAIHSIG